MKFKELTFNEFVALETETESQYKKMYQFMTRFGFLSVITLDGKFHDYC